MKSGLDSNHHREFARVTDGAVYLAAETRAATVPQLREAIAQSQNWDELRERAQVIWDHEPRSVERDVLCAANAQRTYELTSSEQKRRAERGAYIRHGKREHAS